MGRDPGGFPFPEDAAAANISLVRSRIGSSPGGRFGAPADSRQLALFDSGFRAEERATPPVEIPPEVLTLAPPPEAPARPVRMTRRRREAAELAAELAPLQAEYDRLRSLWNLGAAAVELSARRLTGGVIRYGHPHRIQISRHMSPEERMETLRHEAAHAACWARDGNAEEGHGPRFWAIARALGVRRRAAPETEALRNHRERTAIHVYRCEGCAGEWRRARPFGRSMLCASCHRKGKPARLRKERRRKSGRESRIENRESDN